MIYLQYFIDIFFAFRPSKEINKCFSIIFCLSIFLCSTSYAQFGKLKKSDGDKNDSTKTEVVSDSARSKKGGPNMWSKVLAKTAKAAGNLAGSVMGMVKNTANLEEVVPVAGYMVNLHPSAVGEIGQTFFEGWEPGGNAVMLFFTPKNSLGFCKIDGKVNIDGKPANYVAMGIYSAFLKDNSKPKVVEIATTSGQKSSFTLNPPKQSIKIISINGQKANVAIDVTKDVILELENLPVGDPTPVQVGLTGNKNGVKTFYDVGFFTAASKITIPPAMFRNMSGSEVNIGFDECYLQVSRVSMDKATNVSGVFKEMEYGNGTYDGKFVTVIGKPIFNKGLVAAATEKFPGGEVVSYEVKKDHAISSPNLSRMKNLGITSFAIQGKTSFYSSKTKYSGNDSYTTTTKSAQFPQFPDAVWDNILEKAYAEVTAILKSELNVNILPLEKVTGSKGYESIEAFSQDDENTKAEFSRSYKNTKVQAGLMPISAAIGRRTGEVKIMQETGANAIMRFIIGLNMNSETLSMVPSLSYEITGELLGGMFSTTYLSGTVTGGGAGFKNKATIDADLLEKKYLQLANLMAAFRKSLQDIKAKEKANGDYEIEWSAMSK